MQNYAQNHPNYSPLDVSTFKDGKLKLVEPLREHADNSLQWTSDSSVIKYMGADFEKPTKEKEIGRIMEIRNNPDEYNWMIELNGNIIGNVSINRIKETSQKLGLKAGNYTILIGDKEYWGKGIAFHVGMKIMKWAFSKGGFETMSARSLKTNTTSIAMLKKLGFEFSGENPHAEKIDGKSTNWQNYIIRKQQ